MADETIDPHGADDVAQVVNPALIAAAQPETKPEFKATEDGNQVTYGDRKYIREEALHGERQRVQQLTQTLDQLTPLMPEFEQFLQSRKAGNNATVQRAAPQSDSEYTPDELLGYAINRGYYDADNKPDLNRARADLDIMTAIADRRAGNVLRPHAEATTRDRAQSNVARLMTQTFVDNEPIAEEKYLRAALDAVGDDVKSDPAQANMLAVIAAGLQALDDRRNGKSRGARREPNFREGSGRSFTTGGDSGLDALGRAAARARGKTDEQWAKMTKATGGTSFGGDILEEI